MSVQTAAERSALLIQKVCRGHRCRKNVVERARREFEAIFYATDEFHDGSIKWNSPYICYPNISGEEAYRRKPPQRRHSHCGPLTQGTVLNGGQGQGAQDGSVQRGRQIQAPSVTLSSSFHASSPGANEDQPSTANVDFLTQHGDALNPTTLATMDSAQASSDEVLMPNVKQISLIDKNVHQMSLHAKTNLGQPKDDSTVEDGNGPPGWAASDSMSTVSQQSENTQGNPADDLASDSSIEARGFVEQKDYFDQSKEHQNGDGILGVEIQDQEVNSDEVQSASLSSASADVLDEFTSNSHAGCVSTGANGSMASAASVMSSVLTDAANASTVDKSAEKRRRAKLEAELALTLSALNSRVKAVHGSNSSPVSSPAENAGTGISSPTNFGQKPTFHAYTP